jgi:hypothetical protein
VSGRPSATRLRELQERVARMSAEGRISPEDAGTLHEALEEAERCGAARVGVSFSWTLMCLAVLVCLALASAVMPRLSGFKIMFYEMQLKDGLPLLTGLLLSLPGWLYSLGLAVLATVLVAKEYLISSRVTTMAVNAVALFLLVLFAAGTALALFLPMVEMMRLLSDAAS